ncbi:ComF family protein [Albidovulum sediminicola]|uniref:ComF family protein n=1 Tax=Albidovulum sediminicola TaxID=2984331 RepID=A0ABT2YWL7_9RHOB|nr:ComF family protein [Defluviimonas sp. WL0075]MCV2863225.1 ComF family protein [Defluviimonas sp. WL0075]
MGLQDLASLVFPPQCLNCGAATAEPFGLCGACWRETPFITGLVCDRCGTPLVGEDQGHAEYCDDCLALARPWARGRAAILYKDLGRSFVLALKHADRLDLVRPMAAWLERAARPILSPGMLVAPVPLHWSRLIRRRYNQSALLSRALASRAGLEHCPDLLIRRRRTPSQDHRDRDARFANLAGAIATHPRRSARLVGRPVLLVDDVMTSGATFAAAAEACLAAGATEVCILAVARVAKDA